MNHFGVCTYFLYVSFNLIFIDYRLTFNRRESSRARHAYRVENETFEITDQHRSYRDSPVIKVDKICIYIKMSRYMVCTFVHTEMKREKEKCSGPFSSKDDKVWRKERFQVPHPVYTNRSAFVLHISSAKIRRLNVSRTRGRKRGSRDSQAQVWFWPRPERKMALEWLASRDEYRVHTLRTGLLGRTRNGVLKENGKVGRVGEDAFYLPGGCGSVDRSFVHACTAHATLVRACLRGTRHGRVTSDRVDSNRVESLRWFPISIESVAMCFVITRFGLCARSLFAPLDSNYTLLTRLTDGRPLYADWNVLRRCAKASRYCQFPLSRISRANLLAFHRPRYRFSKGTRKPVNKAAFVPFSFIRYSGIVQRNNNNNRKTCNYFVDNSPIILINTTEISVKALVSGRESISRNLYLYR